MFMPSVPLAPCCMYYVYALGEHAAGEQQTHAVGGGVVGQADSEAILGQLVGVGSGNHDVASNGGIDDLFTPRIRGCVSERKTGRCSEQDCHLASEKIVTWQVTSWLENLTTRRYLCVLYLFLSWRVRRRRAL